MRFALIGESRNEYLFCSLIAERMRGVLGPDAVGLFSMDARDHTAEELGGCTIPALEPEFAEALEISAADLPERVRAVEQEFGIANLRTLWRTDILSWRDGLSDQMMARQAIGYLGVFGRVFAENPGLVGGFAEDGGRLIKRCFRWVSLKYGGRMVIALPIPMSSRLLFVEQEDYSLGLPSYEDFEPSPDGLAEAATKVQQVVDSTVQFARPRDLSFTPAKVRNFAALARRQLAGGPASSAYLRTFTRDYGYQRAQLSLLNRFAHREVPATGSFFYPVHVTQDTQMTIRGAPYLDQTWLIEFLARSLPFGYELLVKPHPAAPGEVSAKALYGVQQRHPNVRIMHPSVHAHDVLRRTSALVTVNSTTGFEALMFGVPVVTLGGSLYRYRGLTQDVDDCSDLPAVLAAAVLQPPPPRDDVLKLFAFCLTYSHDVTPSYVDPSRENASRFGDALLAEYGLADGAATPLHGFA